MMKLAQDIKEIRLPKVFKVDDIQLFGMLHLPPFKASSLVITFHGFSSNRMGTNRSHVRVSEALAKRGIASLRFDYRAHGESEGNPEEVTIETLLSDAKKVIDNIQEEGFKKIGFFGSSLGGSLASILSSRMQEQIRAVAVWAPVASGELWAGDFLAKKVAGSLESYRGFPIHDRFRNEFLAMNAAKAISNLDIPFFHAFGKCDEVLSIEHERAFVEARKNFSNNTFKLYPDAGHYLGLYKGMAGVINTIADWFLETL